MTAPQFVWVKGPKGPAPEKWPADPIDSATRGKVVLAQRNITDGEYTLTLAQLATLYPAPAQEPAA